MNVKSLLLEYALPGAVVIGTGLLTFALTGGQEEFPSPDDEFEEDDNMVQQEVNRGSNNYALLDERLDDILMDNERRSDELNQSLQQLNSKLHLLENTEPSWAKELANMARSLAADVESLKSAQSKSTITCSACHVNLGVKVAAAAGDSVSTGRQAVVVSDAEKKPKVRAKVLRDWIKELHYAVYAFSCGNADLLSSSTDLYTILRSRSEQDHQQLINYKPSSDTKVLAAGCAALLMYIGNVVKNPGVPRYRRISTGNSSFKSSLASLAGYDLVLEAVGFSKKGSHFEWEWHSIQAKEEATPSTEEQQQQQQEDGQEGRAALPAASSFDEKRKTKGSVRFSVDEVDDPKVTPSSKPGEDGLSAKPSVDTESPIEANIVDLPYEECHSPADAETVQHIMKECVIILEKLKSGRKDFIEYLLAEVKRLYPVTEQNDTAITVEESSVVPIDDSKGGSPQHRGLKKDAAINPQGPDDRSEGDQDQRDEKKPAKVQLR